jgi:dynein heavy chain 1
VLKSERPDTDQKRTDLLKLQGEFVVRLRFLEKSLLQSLIEARGNLLDDDTILSTLEQLKRESTDIASRMAETNVVMAEIERVTAIYRPFAQSCSSVYFAIDQMATLNHFQSSRLRKPASDWCHRSSGAFAFANG